jgi:hypothetical protein
MAQTRRTKILQVPNPADSLKASNGEKSVQEGQICTTSDSSS